GKPCQLSSGEMLCPVMPKPSKTWALDICWPSATSVLSSVNEGTGGMKSYGNGGRAVIAHLHWSIRQARHVCPAWPRLRYRQPRPPRAANPVPGRGRAAVSKLLSGGRATVVRAGIWTVRQQPGKARSEVVKVAKRWLTWVRRLSFAAVLILAAATPGMAANWSSFQCQHSGCEKAGTVRWIRPLAGAWTVENGMAGTTPAVGQAYAALDSRVAAIGAGLTVSAYQASTGQPLWTTRLTGFAPGSAITAVRVWPGVITVGVTSPALGAAPATGATPAASAKPAASAPPAAGATSAAGATATVRDTPDTGGEGGGGGGGGVGAPPRRGGVPGATTGRRSRASPAAKFGGAVAASPDTTVLVGPHAVTSYANRTGAVRWSRPTGPVPQDWQVDGGQLYLAVAAGGDLGAAPVTALRRGNLATGAQRAVRPDDRAFSGSISLAYQGVVLFSSARWITAYSGTTGRELWHYPNALPDTVDAAAGRLYLISGNTIVGVNPQTGTSLARVSAAS